MTRRPRIAAAVWSAVSAAVLMAPAAAHCQQANPEAQSKCADVTELLAATIARHELPAMAAAMVETDGSITALGAAGVRARGSAAPVTTGDLWHIGSCTKSMTASLCALLVEEGLLRWDQTLGETFPDVEMTDGYSAITLEQLLTNRAGTPEGIGDPLLWSALWNHRGAPTQARRLLLERLAGREPAFQPGSKYAYSNFGFALAGHMCEQVTGEPYETLLIERLLAPIGITTAGFGAPGSADVVDQPRGHAASEPRPPGRDADNPAAISPAGRLHLSITDWGEYIAWHLRGAALARGEPIAGPGPMLSAENFRKLHTPPADDYAMGWGIASRGWAGGAALTHAGSNTLWFCVVWAAPEKGFAVLVATNDAGPTAARGCDDVAGALIHMRSAPPSGPDGR